MWHLWNVLYPLGCIYVSSKDVFAFLLNISQVKFILPTRKTKVGTGGKRRKTLRSPKSSAASINNVKRIALRGISLDVKIIQKKRNRNAFTKQILIILMLYITSAGSIRFSSQMNGMLILNLVSFFQILPHSFSLILLNLFNFILPRFFGTYSFYYYVNFYFKVLNYS